MDDYFFQDIPQQKELETVKGIETTVEIVKMTWTKALEMGELKRKLLLAKLMKKYVME